MAEGWDGNPVHPRVHWSPERDVIWVDHESPLLPQLNLRRHDGAWEVWFGTAWPKCMVTLFTGVDQILNHPIYTPVAIARAVRIQSDAHHNERLALLRRVREELDLLQALSEDH